MTAYNVVRFRTKPGKEQAFIDAHKKASLDATGLRKADQDRRPDLLRRR